MKIEQDLTRDQSVYFNVLGIRESVYWCLKHINNYASDYKPLWPSDSHFHYEALKRFVTDYYYLYQQWNEACLESIRLLIERKATAAQIQRFRDAMVGKVKLYNVLNDIGYTLTESQYNEFLDTFIDLGWTLEGLYGELAPMAKGHDYIDQAELMIKNYIP